MHTFAPADILLPNINSMEKWAVIACDQFVSQPEYWASVRSFVGNAPSTLKLVLPEADLPHSTDADIANINAAMADYLNQGIFKCYEKSYIYVERTLLNGTIRRGVVGAVDLEDYDYTPDSDALIRATEKTVVERIPPRVKIRKDAPIELPHVLLLCDDDQQILLDSIDTTTLPCLYDFDLMEGGGRIRGWLMQGKDAEAFSQKLDTYAAAQNAKYPNKPVLFAVGDGNHSLASAKSCYEALKQANPGADLSNHPARYALVELENIHDASQVFEPIHRIITDTDPQLLLQALEAACGDETGCEVKWFIGDNSGTVRLKLKEGQLCVGAVQAFLDDYLQNHPGETDYIHGDDTVAQLAKADNAIGFLLPVMEKGQFFAGIMADGVLPRKTFSMGHAQEKRYYLESRKIR